MSPDEVYEPFVRKALPSEPSAEYWLGVLDGMHDTEVQKRAWMWLEQNSVESKR